MDARQITRSIPHLTRRAGIRRWSCPSAAQIAGYAEAKLAAADRQRIESHLADCGFCLGQVAFLVRAEGSDPVTAVPTELLETARHGKPRFPKLLLSPRLTALGGLAAVLLILVALQIQGISPKHADRPRATDAASEPVGRPWDSPVRGPRAPSPEPCILHPAEGQVVGTLVSIRWATVPNALDYTVQIVDMAGAVVWEERMAGGPGVIASEAKLKAGQRYFAWVRAHLRAGASSKSPAVGFEVSSR